MRIFIAEDSIENRDTLKYLLAELQHPSQIIGEAGTLEEAYRFLKTPGIDLAFLDIQFREGTIFEVLEKLLEEKIDLPLIVFVTAHGSFEFAVKAIHFACLDFITKPIDQNDLEHALLKADQRKVQTQHHQIAFMLDLLKGDMKTPQSMSIVLPKGVLEFVELRDILYLEADENTCKVILTGDKALHSTKNLGYYHDLLLGNRDFVQISKGCMVNLMHLKRYNHRDKSLQLKSGVTLIASHRYSKALKKQLTESETPGSGLGERFNQIRKIFGG